MTTKRKYSKHYEENIIIKAGADTVFAFVDNHHNFASHMNNSQWWMAGGKFETKIDEGKGQKIGSHIQMSGKILGINMFLDEVIIKREPPFRKSWETVGDLSLLVIGNYELGFELEPENNNSKLKVYIDYGLPRSLRTRWLGIFFGEMYAKMCVQQMINGVKDHFNLPEKAASRMP